MTSPRIESLRKLVGGPRDGALLRFAIGGALLEAGDPTAAVPELREAVSRDPEYSAAWKRLGEALRSIGDREGALAAWRDGVAAAERRGDKQAAKEMQVFLRRLVKA